MGVEWKGGAKQKSESKKGSISRGIRGKKEENIKKKKKKERILE